MVTGGNLQSLALFAANVAGWWQSLRLPCKLAVVASALVLGGMAHVGVIVVEHIKERVLHQSAAAAALYMDSFVERHVQELTHAFALSEHYRRSLGRLLSPAAMSRPIVAFRIWKGDMIVFSNQPDVIGRSYPSTTSRERAWEGHVAVEFERGGDADDDEPIRSLRVPILEVYAPVRETGTNRIIAVVETYEIAAEIKKDIWGSQIVVATAIFAIALAVVLLLFSVANTGKIERISLLGQIGELTRLRAESELSRRRISRANLQVNAMNERSLRNVGHELHDGPAQQMALALLKFDSLERLVSQLEHTTSERHQEDMKAIRTALDESLRHIRRVADRFLPADIETLSVAEVLSCATRHHERRSGVAVTFDSRGLPAELPFPVKAGLYRLALEGLVHVFVPSKTQAQGLIVSCADDGHSVQEHGAVISHALRGLRDRVEAVGGTLRFASMPDQELIAEFSVADMELAHG